MPKTNKSLCLAVRVAPLASLLISVLTTSVSFAQPAPDRVSPQSNHASRLPLKRVPAQAAVAANDASPSQAVVVPQSSGGSLFVDDSKPTTQVNSSPTPQPSKSGARSAGAAPSQSATTSGSPQGKSAAPTASSRTRMARVVHDGAMVYQAPDFDAKVLGRLKAGGTYAISSQVTGAFYKIKVKDGVYGYVADTDVKALLSPEEKKKEGEKHEAKKETERLRKRKSFENERYRGFEVSQINFREDTMGLKPTESLLFFGAKFTGPDIASEGSSTDANILVHVGAPKYYEKATGNSAGGMSLILDFLYLMENQQSKNTMLFYGFGPMFKYSKWDVALNVAGKEEDYSLTDMSLGAVFNFGITHRLESFALRGELQYYWEKMQYLGIAVSVQLPF